MSHHGQEFHGALPKTTPVLGLALLGTDYPGAVERLRKLSKLSQPAAVAACNTHIIALWRQRHLSRKLQKKSKRVSPKALPAGKGKSSHIRQLTLKKPCLKNSNIDDRLIPLKPIVCRLEKFQSLS